MSEVLVLAAHTDDEVLGVGGTIAKSVRSGDNVYVCILCNRATNHKYDDQEIMQRLREDALKAHQVLGVRETFFCGLKDERLHESFVEAIVACEQYIWRIKPDIVYTAHRGDVSQDHQTLFRASMLATRAISLHLVKTVLCYEVLCQTGQAPPFGEYSFTPNYFVDISDTLAIKLEALKMYPTELREFPHPRSLEGIKTSARLWGTKVGCQAAEAFELVRHIVK